MDQMGLHKWKNIKYINTYFFLNHYTQTACGKLLLPYQNVLVPGMDDKAPRFASFSSSSSSSSSSSCWFGIIGIFQLFQAYNMHQQNQQIEIIENINVCPLKHHIHHCHSQTPSIKYVKCTGKNPYCPYIPLSQSPCAAGLLVFWPCSWGRKAHLQACGPRLQAAAGAPGIDDIQGCKWCNS